GTYRTRYPLAQLPAVADLLLAAVDREGWWTTPPRLPTRSPDGPATPEQQERLTQASTRLESSGSGPVSVLDLIDKTLWQANGDPLRLGLLDCSGAATVVRRPAATSMTA